MSAPSLMPTTQHISLGIDCVLVSIVLRIIMRREAGTAPAHARRNWKKTSGTESLYGKSFTTDESVLDRLVAGRAVAPRRSTRAQNNIGKGESKLSSLDRLVAGKSTYNSRRSRHHPTTSNKYDNKGINDHTTGQTYDRYDLKRVESRRRDRSSSGNRGTTPRSALQSNTSSKNVDSKRRTRQSTSYARKAVETPKDLQQESSLDRLVAGRGPPRTRGSSRRSGTNRKVGDTSSNSRTSHNIASLGSSKSNTAIGSTHNARGHTSNGASRRNTKNDRSEQKKSTSLKRNLSIDSDILKKMQDVDLMSPKNTTVMHHKTTNLTSPLSATGASRPHSPYLKYTRPPGRRRSMETGNNKDDSIKLKGIRPSRVKNGWGSKSPELVIDDEIQPIDSVEYKMVNSPKSLTSTRNRKSSPILMISDAKGSLGVSKHSSTNSSNGNKRFGISSGELQPSPVKVAQKLPRNGQLKKDVPVRSKSLGSKSSKKMTNGKQKDETESGSLKNKQNESYSKRPQSRRSRQRPHSGTRMDLKRSNNRAPMFDVAFDLADDNSRSSESRGTGHGRRFVAPPTAWGFST